MANEAKKVLSDDEVEAEIARLLDSPHVKLAKLEARIKNRRRQYMYCLRTMERRGRELISQGVTTESLLTMDDAITDLKKEVCEEYGGSYD